MLVIDDNMLKLAKMQEALLARTANDRQANLERYKKTVIEIDATAFSCVLDEFKQINEHNQSLEEELKYLEQIKGSYDQLVELQCSYRRVCELYGDNSLMLSDMTLLNIEYVEERINVINGYLVNLQNIATNKERLQELNDQLVVEEKNRDALGKRLLGLEDLLRENFLNAEGRCIDGGKLQYISVVSEYEKIDLDFRKLLEDTESLDILISSLNRERIDMDEKLRTAEICYNSIPSSDSKQILEEIKKEFLRIKYRLAMLKIIKLLSESYDNYDLFKEKREKLLDLIKYRLACLEELGVRISIDPFSRTKTLEQLETVTTLRDNSKVVEKIKKEIISLSQRVDEMIEQNNFYMVSLNDTKDLVLSKTRMSDIDISGVTLDVDFEEELIPISVADNQVISVVAVPDKFNLSIVRQKTAGVMKRVSEMMSDASLLSVYEDKTSVPELVIVPKHVDTVKSEPVVRIEMDSKFEDNLFNDLDTLTEDEPVLEVPQAEPVNESNNNEDLFATIIPFESAQMFSDRTDDETSSESIENSLLSLDGLSKNNDNALDDLVLQFEDSSLGELPDLFWDTQDDDEEEIDGEEELSFDEQISALLCEENSNSGNKVRKLAA